MSVRIGFGLATNPFESARELWRWVDLLEAGGVDSLWQTDRLISKQPMLESMSFMAALAGRTERLKFGMNVVVLPFRDPLVLAKQCATIDYLSGGRLLPAFGVGRATAPEFAGAARSPKARGAWTDEVLQFLAKVWSEDDVTFEGEQITYRNVTIEPKPVQAALPIWIGGISEAAIRRTALYGTGWLSGVQAPAQIKPAIEAIRDRSAAAGRPLDADHYGAGFSYRFGTWDEPVVERAAAGLSRVPDAGDPRAMIAVGDTSDIIATVREYISAGASKFVARPLAETPNEVFAQTQRLIDEVLPVIHALDGAMESGGGSKVGIGPKSRAILARLGIATIEEVEERGLVETYLDVLDLGETGATINFLWGLESASTGIYWLEIPAERKAALRAEVERQQAQRSVKAPTER
jgi:probable F420-dependent oxidoreductase